MAELRELFKRRDELLDRTLKGIFAAIPNVIEAAQLFIRDREGTTGTLVWKDISYFDESEYILINGVLGYDIGETVQLPNGMEVEITKQTLQYFNRVIHLGIPYDLAVNGSVDNVFRFFEEVTSDVAEDNNLDGLVESMLQTPESDADRMEFDLDDLTDEQREQLELFSASLKGDN